MNKTKIAWCDYTWNPVIGCSKVAEGCRNCYAEKMAIRLAHMPGKIGDKYSKVIGDNMMGGYFWNNTVFCDESMLDQPLRHKKPAKIFVCSMSDLFHPKVPFEFIDKVMAVIWECHCRENSSNVSGHRFQFLTKRPERMFMYFDSLPWPKVSKLILKMVGRHWGGGKLAFPENLHLGTSVSTQADADKNIPPLLQTPAAFRFVSAEPLLEGISFDRYLGICKHWNAENGRNKAPWHPKDKTKIQYKKQSLVSANYKTIDQIIIGCESGPNRRPCKIEWVRDIVAQCKAARVSVFVKQLEINGKVTDDVSKFPADLRIREMPK